MKEEKFHHTWKPLTGRDGEELQNLRREHGNKCMEDRVSTETSADQYFPAEKLFAHLP